jgi:UDP-N-acetylmuramate dehydrogenase
MFVLGGGSNVVIGDEGFSGLVLQIALMGVTITSEADGTRVMAGAGEPWDGLVRAMVDHGLSGVECLSGIPGTVGGTPIQNVGAYGQEVAGVIERVVAFDRWQAFLTEFMARDCGFSYRMSRFKGVDAGRFVVCGVRFHLNPGPPTVAYPDVIAELERRRASSPGLEDVRQAVLAVRRRKGMVLDAADPDTRSVGSFFMNPVVAISDRERIAAVAGGHVPGFGVGEDRVKIPAAWLIERSGFGKGRTDGAVGLSTKHPLAIVNRGGATTRDVLRFAVGVKRAVIDWSGVWLQPEPVFVGLEGDEDVAFLQKARG